MKPENYNNLSVILKTAVESGIKVLRACDDRYCVSTRLYRQRYGKEKKMLGVQDNSTISHESSEVLRIISDSEKVSFSY